MPAQLRRGRRPMATDLRRRRQGSGPCRPPTWSRWGTLAEPARGPIVVLADGGLLPADIAGHRQGDTSPAESDLLGALKIPLESLAGVLFHPPADRPQRDRLLGRISRGSGDSDRLILDNGDEVTGLVDAWTATPCGSPPTSGRPTSATRRIVALIFTPSREAAAPPPRPSGLGRTERRQPPAGQQAAPLRRLAGKSPRSPARRGRRPPTTWSRSSPWAAGPSTSPTSSRRRIATCPIWISPGPTTTTAT